MPRPATLEELSARTVYRLVAPTLTSDAVVEGAHDARRHKLTCALVRPCDIDLAVRTLQGSDVRAGSVCGFPHGTQNTATKLYEARDLLRRGAREIDVVIGAPALLSREFQHVQTELLQMAEACHKEGALLTVTLEAAYLTAELQIIALRCAERAEADFVATGTGFAPSGYTPEDLQRLRKYLPEETGVTAAEVSSVEEALAAFDAGATRIGTANPVAIIGNAGLSSAPGQSS
jgi:deoxyribose-phosphate aldolase